GGTGAAAARAARALWSSLGLPPRAAGLRPRRELAHPFPRPLWAGARGRGLRAERARESNLAIELQDSFAPVGARPRPQPPPTRGGGMSGSYSRPNPPSRAARRRSSHLPQQASP